MVTEPSLSQDGKHILWQRATPEERQYPCDAWLDNKSCHLRVRWRDPRDDALYCPLHRATIEQRGVDGRYT